MSSKFHERQTEEEDTSYLPLTCTWHAHMTQTYKNIKFPILLFIYSYLSCSVIEWGTFIFSYICGLCFLLCLPYNPVYYLTSFYNYIFCLISHLLSCCSGGYGVMWSSTWSRRLLSITEYSTCFIDLIRWPFDQTIIRCHVNDKLFQAGYCFLTCMDPYSLKSLLTQGMLLLHGIEARARKQGSLIVSQNCFPLLSTEHYLENGTFCILYANTHTHTERPIIVITITTIINKSRLFSFLILTFTCLYTFGILYLFLDLPKKSKWKTNLTIQPHRY